MTCDSTKLLAHVLEAPDAQVEAHLKRCAPCSRDAGAARRLDDELQQVYRYRSIMAAIRVPSERPRRKIYGPLIAFIGLGLAAAAAFFFMVPTHSPIEPFMMQAGKRHIEAQKLIDEKKYDEAIQLYDLILADYHKLSAKAKDDLIDTMVVYKGERRRTDDLKKEARGQLAKIAKWIEEAEEIRANFSHDRVSPFLYKSEWILKTDHAKAAALFKELEAMRDAAIKNWAREQNEFDQLIQDRNYPGAMGFVDGFLLACQDKDEREKALRSKELIVPFAKEHLARVKSKFAKNKATKKEWDETVEKHFKGILPQEDLDKVWEDIQR